MYLRVNPGRSLASADSRRGRGHREGLRTEIQCLTWADSGVESDDARHGGQAQRSAARKKGERRCQILHALVLVRSAVVARTAHASTSARSLSIRSNPRRDTGCSWCHQVRGGPEHGPIRKVSQGWVVLPEVPARRCALHSASRRRPARLPKVRR